MGSSTWTAWTGWGAGPWPSPMRWLLIRCPPSGPPRAGERAAGSTGPLGGKPNLVSGRRAYVGPGTKNQNFGPCIPRRLRMGWNLTRRKRGLATNILTGGGARPALLRVRTLNRWSLSSSNLTPRGRSPRLLASFRVIGSPAGLETVQFVAQWTLRGGELLGGQIGVTLASPCFWMAPGGAAVGRPYRTTVTKVRGPSVAQSPSRVPIRDRGGAGNHGPARLRRPPAGSGRGA